MGGTISELSIFCALRLFKTVFIFTEDFQLSRSLFRTRRVEGVDINYINM